MDLIKEIVQNILIIVFLSLLLDMLMPKSDMGKYVKLIMGLFIIIAVLNPILSVLNKDFSIVSIKAPSDDGEDLKGLLDKGRAFSAEKQQAALADYEKKVAQQVAALIRLNGKAGVQKVVVEAGKNPEEADYGSIQGIRVYLGKSASQSGSKGAEIVKPVEINVNESKQGEENQELTGDGSTIELQKVLADFYGIDPKNIKVYADK